MRISDWSSDVCSSDLNWLPTTPGSRKLFIRQGFDRWDETPATLGIERVGMNEPASLPTPQAMIDAFDWAGAFVTGLMRDWPDHPYRHGAPIVDPTCVNRFPGATGGDGSDARRGRAVAHLCWALAIGRATLNSSHYAHLVCRLLLEKKK